MMGEAHDTAPASVVGVSAVRSSARCCLDRAGHGMHHRAGAHAHQAADDDVVLGRDAAADDAQPLDTGRRSRHISAPRCRRRDRHHRLARLVRHQGGRRQQQHRCGRPVGRRSRANWPGVIARSGSARWRAHGSCRCCGRSRCRGSRACRARSSRPSPSRSIATSSHAVAGMRAHIGHVVRLAHVEIEMDRIERDDVASNRGRARCRRGCRSPGLPTETWCAHRCAR